MTQRGPWARRAARLAWWRRAPARHHRSQLLVGLAGVFAILFAVTVVQAVRAQHGKLQAATCFFAADASRVLVARSRLFLSAATAPLFAAVGGRAPLPPGAVLPPPAALAAAASAVERCHCAPPLVARGYFRLDAADNGEMFGPLQVAPAVISAPATSALATSALAGLDSEGVRSAVARSLPLLMQDGVVAIAVPQTTAMHDSLRAVAIVSAKVGWNGALRAVYGILMGPREFAASIVAPVFDQTPLFTWALSDGNRYRNADIATIALLDAHWTPLYQSGPMPSYALSPDDKSDGCFGMTPLDPALASLMAHVVVHPQVAARWVAMGTDLSRLPFLALLLAGMLTCGGAAAVAARREAELATLRSDFVTSISHELRMPLAQILLFGETLSLGRARSQAERDDAADAIVREAQRLTGVVDNVLYFSRVEHHNLTVTPEAVDLRSFVEDVRTDLRPLAESAGVRIDEDVPAGLSAHADPRALRQVLYDLVDNAIKYGPRGQQVTIGAAAEGQGVHLWVEDEGAGIPPESAETIFEPFVRLERDRNSAVSGSGLGLAVSRELVGRHGGRIWAGRASGGGARFTMELPAAGQPAAVPSTVTEQPVAGGRASPGGMPAVAPVR